LSVIRLFSQRGTLENPDPDFPEALSAINEAGVVAY